MTSVDQPLLFQYPQGHNMSWLVGFLGFVGYCMVFWFVEDSRQQQVAMTQNLLVQEASSHFQSIKNLQLWHAKFGGVFQQPGNGNDYSFEILSNRPKNHFNQAYGFAAEALQQFAENLQLKELHQFSENQTQFQYIGALHVKELCLQCHEDYQLGDVRGGVKINLPLEKYQSALSQIRKDAIVWKATMLVFFLMATSIIIFFVEKLYQSRRAVQSLNSSLEQKVRQRTAEVHNLYNREHYLKSLLENMLEINESLISSFSMSDIVESSMDKLNNHPNYQLIVFGHFESGFHIHFVKGEQAHLVDKTEYSLVELAAHPLLHCILEVIASRRTSQYDQFAENHAKNNTHISMENQLKSSIALPLNESAVGLELSVLALWTNRPDGFDKEEVNILDSVTKDISMAISAYKQRLLNDRLQKEKVVNYEETILAFVDMIEQRDAYTAGHTLRVAKYSRLIASTMGLEEAKIERIEKAAILHDIGKIATPDTILLKPGKLRPLEYELIKNHVTAGYKMLSKIKMYQDLAELIKYHHEHYDGSGYPQGVGGEEIPIEAHILIVADAFDAMTSNRIYKPRKTVADALAEISRMAGTQFHPQVAEIAQNSLAEVEIGASTQLPQSDLESKRFSYFFNDNVTGLYNMEYLRVVMDNYQEYQYAWVLSLQHFSDFNNEHGWKKGDELLQCLAELLTSMQSDCKIFRFHVSDFIVLSPDKLEIDLQQLDTRTVDPQQRVTLEAQSFNLFDQIMYERFYALTEL